jgi:hypothetical protein
MIEKTGYFITALHEDGPYETESDALNRISYRVELEHYYVCNNCGEWGWFKEDVQSCCKELKEMEDD